jgi:hypothetical protein
MGNAIAVLKIDSGMVHVISFPETRHCEVDAFLEELRVGSRGGRAP